MSSPELKFPFGGDFGGNQFPKVNFKFYKSSPVQKCLKPKLPFLGGRGGWVCRTWNAWNLVLPPSMHLGWTSRFWHKILQHILGECITDSSLRKLNNRSGQRCAVSRSSFDFIILTYITCRSNKYIYHSIVVQICSHCTRKFVVAVLPRDTTMCYNFYQVRSTREGNIFTGAQVFICLDTLIIWPYPLTRYWSYLGVGGYTIPVTLPPPPKVGQRTIRRRGGLPWSGDHPHPTPRWVW